MEPSSVAVFPQTIYAAAMLYVNERRGLQINLCRIVVEPGCETLSTDEVFRRADDMVWADWDGDRGEYSEWKMVSRTMSILIQERGP